MKKVILDTSFILSCAESKIDFFDELQSMGLKIIVPEEVMREIKGILNSKQKSKQRDKAKIALSIMDKSVFDTIKLGTKNVDDGIIKYAKKNPDSFVATLDREIKRKALNSNIVIRNKKQLEVI